MVIGFKKQFVEPILNGTKIHTMRDDKTDRWSKGKLMHMATGVRTKNYTCFKKTNCTNTQEVVLRLTNNKLSISITIGGFDLNAHTKKLFIIRDGFANEADFIKWFFPKGDGIAFKKLLHWTDLQY